MNITISRVPLLFVMTSIMVVSRRSYAATGRKFSNSFTSSAWKFGTGMNGMSVKRKIDAGSSAISMLKAMDEALVTGSASEQSLDNKGFTTRSSGALNQSRAERLSLLCWFLRSAFPWRSYKVINRLSGSCQGFLYGGSEPLLKCSPRRRGIIPHVFQGDASR